LQYRHVMGVYRLLEKAPALANVEPELLQRFSDAATTRSLRRGEYLWRAGDPPRAMTLLKSGLVKVVRPAPRGRCAICGLFGPPETLGDLALIKGIPYPADAVIATDSASVVQIPRALIVEALQKSPHLGTAIACATHTKLVALHDKIDVLAAGAVEARLATLLLKLYDQFGDDAEDGTSFIPVALSRRELSDLVSTSFETAIRVMTRWEREGVLTTETSGFVIKRMPVIEESAGPLHACRPAAE
jgi:CRP/FNR family transcriptional regulator, nitrogen oxide reductase regulator